jgi:putative ABC transport system permease protein
MLFAERRRATLTILGVACALLLVLVLRGIFAGAIEQVTNYIRTSPAEIFVSQAGVRTMHMSASALPTDSVAEVAAVPGVAWAEPIGFATGSVAGPDGRQLSYVIGYDTTTGRGGPSTLETGRQPGPGEAVLDRQAADQLGIKVDDLVTVLGTPLRIVGLSSGGTNIANTTVFVSAEQFQRMGHHEVSYILIGVEDDVSAGTVAGRVQDALPGATVQTREEFADSETRVVTDMSADLLRLMSTIGLLIALAVIALGLMTATLSQIRDYAVLKASGANTLRLAGTVAVQVVVTVALATAAATVLALGLGVVLPLLSSSVPVSVTAPAVGQTAGGALLAGLIAALWPLRRIASIDAATTFRETR